MKDDIIDICMNEARKSTMLHRHGAIIYRNGEILSAGHNHRIYHMCHAFSCHAEVAAIKSIKNRSLLKNASLIVVRVGNDDNIKGSKPCENCKQAIERSGIKKVFYST